MRRARREAPAGALRRNGIACAALFGCMAVILLSVPAFHRSRDAVDAAPRFNPPLPNGGSVFFVGNSLIGWEGRDLPDWIAALGEAQGIPFRVGSDIEPGDLPLSDFLRHPAVAEALASGKYDLWVLQGHELEPVDHPEAFRRAVRDFYRAISASGGRAVLFMTWEFPWRRFMPVLAEAYDSIGRELRIPVIPAGLVYRDCEEAPFDGQSPFFLTATPEYPKGSVHENRLGSATSAYVSYAILTGRNPAGLPFGLPDSDIEPRMRAYLSDRAWARALPRLIAGRRRSAGRGSAGSRRGPAASGDRAPFFNRRASCYIPVRGRGPGSASIKR